MSSKGLFRTDIYCFGLLSWRVLFDGHNPFKHIRFCESQTRKSRTAAPIIYEFHFTERADAIADKEVTGELSSVEIHDLKSCEDDALLRLIISSMKKHHWWTSQNFAGLEASQVLAVITSIFSKCLRQNPMNRALSMGEIVMRFSQNQNYPV